MDENGMGVEEIVMLVGSILYAINIIGAAIPNVSKFKWLQPALDILNIIAINFGYNKNAESTKIEDVEGEADNA